MSPLPLLTRTPAHTDGAVPAVATPIAWRLVRRCRRGRRASNVTLGIGAGIVALYVLAAVLAPLIAPADPNAGDLLRSFEPPSAAHLMGTDSLGRDVFSRVLYAARIDLPIGVVVTYVPLTIGVGVGLVCGYFGGRLDAIVMRVVDVVIAFPFMVLVLALLAVVGPGLTGIYIAIPLVSWSLYARITRAEMLVLRERDFITAARALGYSTPRILLRHALPNVLRPSLVFSMSDVVSNIMLAASISFIGLGVRPPTPEWGSMIAEGQIHLERAWWISTMPGLAILLFGIGLSLLGDAIADRLGTTTSSARRG